jgi:hypothetical protein
MKLEIQVCSQSLARVMAELGFEQDSLWYYAKFEDDSHLDVIGAIPHNPTYQLIREGTFDFVQFNEIYAAYTIAELGEILPIYYSLVRQETSWCCANPDNSEDLRSVYADTGANACALMCIQLRKEGLRW